MNVLLADDHGIVRTGLKHILESHNSIKKVFEASNGEEALKVIKAEKLDLIVLDLAMPKLTGLDVLTLAKEKKLTEAKFLILSMFPEKEYAMRVFRAGAAGYVTKDSVSDDLHKAIDAVLNGKKFISEQLRERMFDINIDEAELSPHEKLSDREFKVFILLSKGKRNQEIANKLFISEKTVHTYKSRIFEKMNLESVSELTKYAFQHKLIE